MKLKVAAFFCFVWVFGFSQTNTLGIWNDHIPQSTIYDIAYAKDMVYCATDIGMFTYNDNGGELTTYSKLHGLSDIGIRAIAYDSKRDLLLMGYKNGNLDIFDGENIRNINDIFRSPKYVGLKRINHIKVDGDIAYLSTGFGIVELDLDNFIILNTFIIGPDATETEVFEVDIDEDRGDIYAATENGLLRAKTSDPLIFFSFWKRVTELSSGICTEVDVFNEYVFTNFTTPPSKDDSVFYFDGSSCSYFSAEKTSPKTDIRAENGYLNITSTYNSKVYNPDLSLRYNLSGAVFPPESFRPSVALSEADGSTIWIGNFGTGLIKSVDVFTNKRILPSGPNSSEAYRLTAENNTLYVSSGSIDGVWTRQYLGLGIYHYEDFEWINTSSSDLNDIKDIVNITVHPTNPDKIFASCWGTGVAEITNGTVDTIWDNISTGGALQGSVPSGNPDDVRTGGIVFDENENMWMTNSLVERPLVVRRKDGTWNSYSLGSLGNSSKGFKDIIIDELGQFWLQTRSSGIVVVKFVNGLPVYNAVTSGIGKGNLPSTGVLSFAEDEDGEIWIGTDAGLVVCYSPQNIFNNNNFDAQPVLFEEDGVVQRLLGAENVTAIAIDGSNKKWFGTLNSGVFYTSKDGVETIYHFTQENSPLLSNSILDIAIDHTSGEVYFLTTEGIVSFRGSATAGNETYTNVYTYPNPVRPGYEGPIFIRGLVTNAQVKITDVQGNLVYEMVAEGGQAVWYGKDLNGNTVATGVYIAYITNDDGSLVATTKILKVN